MILTKTALFSSNHQPLPELQGSALSLNVFYNQLQPQQAQCGSVKYSDGLSGELLPLLLLDYTPGLSTTWSLYCFLEDEALNLQHENVI